MAGKGSKPRPVKKSVYDKNFDEIFRKSTKKVTRGVITQEIYNVIVKNTE